MDKCSGNKHFAMYIYINFFLFLCSQKWFTELTFFFFAFGNLKLDYTHWKNINLKKNTHEIEELFQVLFTIICNGNLMMGGFYQGIN